MEMDTSIMKNLLEWWWQDDDLMINLVYISWHFLIYFYLQLSVLFVSFDNLNIIEIVWN